MIDENKQNVELAILRVLSDEREPLSGSRIAEIFATRDSNLSERTVRLYLQRLDEEGLTEAKGRSGRIITDKGRTLLDAKRFTNRVGFMSVKIDRMAYAMNFDLALRRGKVLINTAIVERGAFRRNLREIEMVFEKGYAMGTLVGLAEPGEEAGSIIVPPGHVGFCTVCSITLNGVFLKYGVPIRSVFSGLLELENGEAKGFVESITYDGTSVDPLQLFIRARMTDYLGAIRDGNGKIGAGFREIPEESYELALTLSEKLESIGLNAFFKIGKPSCDLLNVPVRDGCCGIIVIGGLNPVAVLEESGTTVQHHALSGYMEYTSMFPYTELRSRL
ncbi:NrpR regulatory domain-containing protein [Treponema sp.]